VGPKIALALCRKSASKRSRDSSLRGHAALIRVPGIGARQLSGWSSRCRDRLKTRDDSRSRPAGLLGAVSPETEAYGALIALGSGRPEATRFC